MNTLVVYDSQFGNTKKIAEAMATALKDFGEARAVHVNQADPANFRGVDLLILGCPIQGWKPTTAMQSFLERLRPEHLSGLKAAGFDTRMRLPRFLRGSGAEVIAARLSALGVEPLLPPEGFLVKSKEGPMRDGEEQRAISWAQMLQEKYEASQSHLGFPSRQATSEQQAC